MQYWRETLKCFKNMKYKRCKADPCIYFRWIAGFLIVWMGWVNDLHISGPKGIVLEEKDEMKARFDCDDVGKTQEYVGCKIERDKFQIRLTQPVLMQSFEDELIYRPKCIKLQQHQEQR